MTATVAWAIRLLAWACERRAVALPATTLVLYAMLPDRAGSCTQIPRAHFLQHIGGIHISGDLHAEVVGGEVLQHLEGTAYVRRLQVPVLVAQHILSFNCGWYL